MSMQDYPSDWNQRRKNVLERDNYTCQGCGISNEKAKERTNRGLHAHHRTPISEGGSHSLQNLIALCETCHIETHRKNTEAPYEAIFWDTCNNCGREHSNLEGFNSEFCSQRCMIRDKTERALNVLQYDSNLCSRCFHRISKHHEVCPNCGSWEFHEPLDKFEREIDIQHLIERSIEYCEKGN